MSVLSVVAWTSLAIGFTSSLALASPALRLVECGEVNLLASACPGDSDDETDGAPPSTPPSAAEPLFTLQTMRPDTPPLLLKVFNEPTPANIEAYLAWEHRYLARIVEVEALLKQHRQQRKR